MSNGVLEALERSYPNATWEACDELLWLTPFPMASAEVVVARIDELRKQYGPNIGDAINGVSAEIDAQFKQYKKDHPQDFA